jgi:hypothetical protein
VVYAAALDACHRASELSKLKNLAGKLRFGEVRGCMLPCTDVSAAGCARVFLLLLPLELLQRSQCRCELRSRNCACFEKQ